MADKDAPTDLDAVADELYTLPPPQFTAARNTHARAARKAGNRPLADRITALRKPTTSAWAANLLARERRDETGPLLQLGDALRQAHRKLDGEQLRRLNRRQRELVHALSQQAGQLAAQAGQPLTGQAMREVEETLHAALADPEAGTAFAEGRLTRPLSATVDIAGQATTARGPQRAQPPPRQARKKRPAEDAEDKARARREADRQRRREEAEQAEREAQAREHEATTVRHELDLADRHHDEAQSRLGELLRQVKDAEETLRTARDAQDRARRRLRDADKAARKAAARAGRLTERLDQDP
ncbi:hypothetical protein [Actinacidiphila sp. bgisy160]|uniref:hypothetical protein n=1 Tax=Actinacidiphila sp. bgisy160 TaxID=3413796 RepID=UPI003D729D24